MKAAVYTALLILALLLFVAGTISPFATKTGVSASLWETCTGGNCTATAPACTTAKDAIYGGRAMCVLATIFAGCGAISGFIETCWPDTVNGLQNACLGVGAAMFAAAAFSIGTVLWTTAMCKDVVGANMALKDLDYDMGGNAPCFIAGFVLVLCGVLFDLLGPKSKLDYDREEQQEQERREREMEEERQRELERKDRAVDSMLRSHLQHKVSTGRSVSSIGLPTGPPPPRSAAATPRGVVPPSPRGAVPPSPRGSGLPPPRLPPPAPSGGRSRVSSTVGTPRGAGFTTPRAPPPPPPPASRGNTPRSSSPVRAPIISRSPRVSSYSTTSSINGGPDGAGGAAGAAESSFGIGDDGSAWELDPKTGWYYSEEQGLFFDDVRQVFVDPETLQTCPPGGEWSE